MSHTAPSAALFEAQLLLPLDLLRSLLSAVPPSGLPGAQGPQPGQSLHMPPVSTKGPATISACEMRSCVPAASAWPACGGAEVVRVRVRVRVRACVCCHGQRARECEVFQMIHMSE